MLDIKRPELRRVRPKLRKRWLTEEGYGIPKTRAARRPVPITGRPATIIGSMGLGDSSDWVFTSHASIQIAQNETL